MAQHDALSVQGRRRRKLLAAPDSFKGTCSASEVARAIEAGAGRAGWEVDLCPMSDGGEGFTEVLAESAERGGWVSTRVTGPLGGPVEARWWLAGEEAVMECAAASGLVLAGGARGNDPLDATSRGTGELIVAALARGAKKVLVGMGGSATTDGGRGAVDAIVQAGGFAAAEVVVACDVKCPFVEAAQRFGPQKGASEAQVAELRLRLERLARSYHELFGVDVTALPDAGAAGGLAGGLAALGAQLVGGFDLVAAEVSLSDRIDASSLVVTGEGTLDGSSWSGKVVGGVVERCASAAVRVLVVAGRTSTGADPPSFAAELVETVSLEDRYGSLRSMEDPRSCISEVVSTALGEGGR